MLATADANGIPNVTYLSCAHVVDGERIALSNQFFSKTARNIMENPRASLLLIDPRDYGEYRVTLRYERTDRHGPAFEALRRDVDTVAALQGMQDVFRLRAADVYRVLHVERVRAGVVDEEHASSTGTATGGPAEIAELSMRLGRAPDLDTLVATALRGLDELLGFRHSILMLVDETGTRLYTIASHGYAAEGVGSEVAVGEGTIGVVADQCRVGARRQRHPGAQVRACGPGELRGRGDRRSRAPRSRCPAWSWPRRSSRCRRWRWAGSSAC